MKQSNKNHSKRVTKDLTIPEILAHQIDGVIQIAGRPAKKRSGFLLELNFAIQSTINGKVKKDQAREKPAKR